MISLTRLNGDRFAINADLIERAEETPDTVITLTNGAKYLVAETLDELLHQIQVHRARILALAGQMADDVAPAGDQRLRLLVAPEPSTAAKAGGGDGDGVRPGPSPERDSEIAGNAATEPPAASQPAPDRPQVGGRWHR
jgi:flagellar protein FlbD